MPLYEYECGKCAHRFEKIQKFSDPPVESCPKCGGPVQKLLSSPAIQFKGTGWYVTDYARKDSAAAEKTGASAKAETSETKADKAEAKADTRPDTKAEAKTDPKPS